MPEPGTVLAVDDQPQNRRLLEAILMPLGYRVLQAASGDEALQVLDEEDVDLVLLDVLMPGMDGHEVCRRIRSDEATAFLPVVMITASGEAERLKALEAGADDFVAKPFEKAELVARVASLSRLKHYHDEIHEQARSLARWNDELNERVQAQVAELERLGRLRRFLSPQLADLILESGDDSFLRSHRREIVVAFCDLRNFTPFAEASEPEEVMAVLAEYHHALGELIHEYEGTLERFTGDGLMVFFNDPIPCDDGPRRAVDMAVAMRSAVRRLAQRWSTEGHELALGVGIAQGYATLGRIGFEGRYDYAAIGSVTNLAARLCSAARPWQVLVTQKVLVGAGEGLTSEALGELKPTGFSRSFRIFDITDRDLEGVQR
jgi:adenylate cyclase